MALSVQDALIHIMVVTASSDEGISQNELDAIADQVVRAPVFDSYDMDRLEAGRQRGRRQDQLPRALKACSTPPWRRSPKRLHDTAYALAVEIAVIDVELPQEELRLLEMVRDRLTCR